MEIARIFAHNQAVRSHSLIFRRRMGDGRLNGAKKGGKDFKLGPKSDLLIKRLLCLSQLMTIYIRRIWKARGSSRGWIGRLAKMSIRGSFRGFSFVSTLFWKYGQPTGTTAPCCGMDNDRVVILNTLLAWFTFVFHAVPTSLPPLLFFNIENDTCVC